MKHKRNDPMCDPWDSQVNEKKRDLFFIAFCLDVLIRNENITSEECKTKNPFEIILHAGRVTSPTNPAYNNSRCTSEPIAMLQLIFFLSLIKTIKAPLSR